jgi:hypothetical protein
MIAAGAGSLTAIFWLQYRHPGILFGSILAAAAWLIGYVAFGAE